MKIELEFHEGIPADDGWYLIELHRPTHLYDAPYTIDFCRARSPSDGGGREWVSSYGHTVKRWAKLP